MQRMKEEDELGPPELVKYEKKDLSNDPEEGRYKRHILQFLIYICNTIHVPLQGQLFQYASMVDSRCFIS